MTTMIWWQNTDPPATCSIQGSLALGLEEAVIKSPSNAGSLIAVSQRAQICRNVHMATRIVCSSTSTSTSKL